MHPPHAGSKQAAANDQRRGPAVIMFYVFCVLIVMIFVNFPNRWQVDFKDVPRRF